MAVDYFLKLSGIRGESQDSKHPNEIDVLSFSWGVSQTGASATGGAASGKASFNDFAVIKFVDAATPQLMQACCNGTHIPEANFIARKQGDTQLEYLKIKLTDVLISGVQPSGSQGATLPTEQVNFSFGGSTITTVEEDPKGGIGSTETATLCGGSRV